MPACPLVLRQVMTDKNVCPTKKAGFEMNPAFFFTPG